MRHENGKPTPSENTSAHIKFQGTEIGIAKKELAQFNLGKSPLQLTPHSFRRQRPPSPNQGFRLTIWLQPRQGPHRLSPRRAPSRCEMKPRRPRFLLLARLIAENDYPSRPRWLHHPALGGIQVQQQEHLPAIFPDISPAQSTTASLMSLSTNPYTTARYPHEVSPSASPELPTKSTRTCTSGLVDNTT